MKKDFSRFFILVLFCSAMTGNAQTPLTLTFYGKDSVNQNLISLDSVHVKNLTENCDTLLYGPVPVLSLIATWPYDIEENEALATDAFIVKQNYPNPFQASTCVELRREYGGTINLVLFDGLGRILAAYHNEMSKGSHYFRISSSGKGILFLTASDNKYNRSIKVICAGQNGINTIEYLGHNQDVETKEVVNHKNSGFTFFIGNQMTYAAYSDGYHDNTKFDNPVKSTTYEFKMKPVNTILIPTVTTTAITNILPTAATGGGNVSSDGGAYVTVRGICWSTSPGPTTAGIHTTDGSGTGTFISSLSGLTSGTTYYVRAYAINSAGAGYGEEVMFISGQGATLPVVTTAALTNITVITATSGGNVTSDGGATVNSRGVCWNTSPNPTDEHYTTDGYGTGPFVSNLYGLTSGTTYYVRAYARNSIGTAYGNEITFTTLGITGETCPGIPTVTYEGKTYNTIQIGQQCWLRENLNVGIKVAGDQNQANNGIKEKYCYDDDDANCTLYGGLYQWDELMQYDTIPGTQGLCPSGWHIAEDSEWIILRNNLGGESVAGGKMKETGTQHWNSPNTGATNESGFTGLPGGYRYYIMGSSFWEAGNVAYFWTSTIAGPVFPVFYILRYNNGNLISNSQLPSWGLPARCLKD